MTWPDPRVAPALSPPASSKCLVQNRHHKLSENGNQDLVSCTRMVQNSFTKLSHPSNFTPDSLTDVGFLLHSGKIIWMLYEAILSIIIIIIIIMTMVLCLVPSHRPEPKPRATTLNPKP